VSNPDQPAAPSETAKALVQLHSLPSLEDTKVQVQEAVDSIKAAAVRAVPAIVWTEFDQGAKANCAGPYGQSDGRSFYFPDAVADHIDVSEESWAAILKATGDAAARLGATDVQVMQNKPGKHDVWFSGPAGLFVKISHSVSLVVATYTGCRLPADKK
jgi:hypothetical protein